MDVYRASETQASQAGRYFRRPLLVTERMRAFMLGLEPNFAVQNHAHAESDELLYVFSGSASFLLGDGSVEEVSAGDAVVLDPGEWHQITTGASPLDMLAVVAPNLPDALTEQDA